MDEDDAKSLRNTQHAESMYREWLNRHNLQDSTAADFALTPRSRRLRVQGTEGVADPKVRLLVTAVFVPKPPWEFLWKPSDTSIYSWLTDQSRSYEPFNDFRTLPRQASAMHGGVQMNTPDSRNSQNLRHYIAIERTGIVELGLGANACVAIDDRKGFLLTPIVAQIWQTVGLTCDLYARFKQRRSFTLLVNMRETEDALLGGLASGWKQPWGHDGYKKVCSEPNVQLIHEELKPLLDKDGARELATEIAFEIEAAWGMGGERFYPRCFTRTDDGSQGEFDLAAIRE